MSSIQYTKAYMSFCILITSKFIIIYNEPDAFEIMLLRHLRIKHLIEGIESDSQILSTDFSVKQLQQIKSKFWLSEQSYFT
jgi:hypothetical protein